MTERKYVKVGAEELAFLVEAAQLVLNSVTNNASKPMLYTSLGVMSGAFDRLAASKEDLPSD